MNAEKRFKNKKIHSMIKQAMNTSEYKKARQEDLRNATLQAFVRIRFVGCEYIEMNYRGKKKALEKWLDFLKGRMEEIGDDKTYFKDVAQYYKEEHDLDVLRKLGLQIKDEEQR